MRSAAWLQNHEGEGSARPTIAKDVLAHRQKDVLLSGGPCAIDEQLTGNQKDQIDRRNQRAVGGMGPSLVILSTAWNAAGSV